MAVGIDLSRLLQESMDKKFMENSKTSNRTQSIQEGIDISGALNHLFEQSTNEIDSQSDGKGTSLGELKDKVVGKFNQFKDSIKNSDTEKRSQSIANQMRKDGTIGGQSGSEASSLKDIKSAGEMKKEYGSSKLSDAWDATKGHMKEHGGKYAAGAAVVGAGLAARKYMKSKASKSK